MKCNTELKEVNHIAVEQDLHLRFFPWNYAKYSKGVFSELFRAITLEVFHSMELLLDWKSSIFQEILITMQLKVHNLPRNIDCLDKFTAWRVLINSFGITQLAISRYVHCTKNEILGLKNGHIYSRNP